MVKHSPVDIVPGVYPIDAGTAEISEDPFTPGCWLLTINGAESSQLNPDQPTVLGFEYMRWIAAVIEHRFTTDTPLKVLHLGAAGCTLARWITALYPGAHQTAVEYDAGLAALARDRFGLPRAPALKIRVAEAGEVLAAGYPDTRDVIIRDVFADDDAGRPTTPAHLTGVEPAQHAARQLGAHGVYLVNYGGGPGMSEALVEQQALAEVFAHVVAIADPAMFKGRRRGNVIFACSQSPLTVTELGGESALTRALLSDPVPAQLRHIDPPRPGSTRL